MLDDDDDDHDDDDDDEFLRVGIAYFGVCISGFRSELDFDHELDRYFMD